MARRGRRGRRNSAQQSTAPVLPAEPQTDTTRLSRKLARAAEKAALQTRAGDPTPEQERHNHYAHVEFREKWNAKPVQVRRNVTARPIDRYKARRTLTERQWLACDKYRGDYDRAGFEASITARYEPGGGSTCSAPVGHLPASLIQLDARARLRDAADAIPKRLRPGFDLIVLDEVEPSATAAASDSPRRDTAALILCLGICADILGDFYRL